MKILEADLNRFYSLLIHNTHASHVLYVTFNHTTFKEIVAGASLTLTASSDGQIVLDDHLYLKADNPGTTYEILVIEEKDKKEDE